MIKKLLTVLLIEDNREYAALVQRWLAPKDDIEFAVTWADSLAGAAGFMAAVTLVIALLPALSWPMPRSATRTWRS